MAVTYQEIGIVETIGNQQAQILLKTERQEPVGDGAVSVDWHVNNVLVVRLSRSSTHGI